MFSPSSMSPKQTREQFDFNDKASILNEDLDFSDAISDGGTAAMVTQKQMKADISFLSKSEFENQDRCLICNISFVLFGQVSQHHCRACGASVCGPCSRRQINENRVCDICFLRCFLKKTELRRQEQLETKKQTIVQLKTSQNKLKEEIKSVDKQLKDLRENKETENEQLRKNLELKKKEMEETSKDLVVHEQMLSQAESQLRTEKHHLQDLERQQTQFEAQLKGIQVELEQKNKILEQKEQQVKSLVDQKNKLTSTKSFLNYKNRNNEKTYNESDEENDDETVPPPQKQVRKLDDPKPQQQQPKESTDHYRASSITKDPPKNYEINQKQPSDECSCIIF